MVGVFALGARIPSATESEMFRRLSKSCSENPKVSVIFKSSFLKASSLTCRWRSVKSIVQKSLFGRGPHAVPFSEFGFSAAAGRRGRIIMPSIDGP